MKMNETVFKRLFILNMSKQAIEKKFAQVNIKIKNQSDKLFLMDDNNSTVRRRAAARASLSTLCEERDRWQCRLDEIAKWMDEIRND
ncbi:hypothetical protein CN692_19140 [Bacillus sp. AFS002410]|uniref:hypothetical protein n=1 Tax=Bacillus sp. AFS002410 TaxID=2033481 RepID=UPI000BEFD9B4|nr:hypothetical protein [Bacillus sp. AFS002410]PEJ56078.1 hypothetical protein CN692_19140 [Bacillus sp. AFS002410]